MRKTKINKRCLLTASHRVRDTRLIRRIDLVALRIGGLVEDGFVVIARRGFRDWQGGNKKKDQKLGEPGRQLLLLSKETGGQRCS